MNYQPDIIFATLKMVAALAAVLSCLVIILYFAKRQINKQTGIKGTQLIKILASRYIGVKKMIALVEVPGSVLVLGITNEKVSLLDKIDNKETLIQCQQADKADMTATFSDQFNKLCSNFGGKKE